MPDQTISINEATAEQCAEHLGKVLGNITGLGSEAVNNLAVLERLTRLALANQEIPEHPADE